MTLQAALGVSSNDEASGGQ
uniref:Uncharacterized protein n=1 Tax=Plectus sambesii TaxID=2011161 RepID=A0A914VRC4_9BILA